MGGSAGLGHYEGRGWRGFHHHAALSIAACGFLVSSGVRFPLRLTLVWRALAWRLFACRLPGGYAPSDPNGRVELKPPTPASVTIRALRRHLLARRFAVPKLQRNFVWDAGRAAKLLDRIYREMPIYGYSDCHMSSNYG